jgi:HD superfamily phosphodiesterase
MTVPGRVEAAALLLSLGPPAWFLRHSRAVAEIAAWLARRASVSGTPVDRRLVDAAALLHDVDKLLPDDDPARRLSHGAGSAAWLERHGHGELGPAVTGHPVTQLADPRADAWLRDATLEERIVAYADKRSGQRLESMDERFASWRRRYPTGWSAAEAAAATARARRLETAVCAAAEVTPDEVRRLRWTGPALRAATRPAP